MGTVKTIGKSGQVSLGKKFAGQQVLVDEIEEGVWICKVGRFIPESEQWLHAPKIKEELDLAIDWAEKNPPRTSDLSSIEEQVE
ncbi:conserved hypothetical protein [Desulfonatronospira thiodismutans ASO3-1]|uniref:Uncharacterized protein n=1 Tax=Desulfonatronospira thiodismutans ASO3-1 TaxID=555779 RepID=D6SSA6_9BACT|nr:hypothetical protein [Desulfonatronospira thiodismutans]EFI33572.1 conserved hypothetical protein [Desulfonatronospira thiodismutans ASO3-1]